MSSHCERNLGFQREMTISLYPSLRLGLTLSSKGLGFEIYRFLVKAEPWGLQGPGTQTNPEHSGPLSLNRLHLKA